MEKIMQKITEAGARSVSVIPVENITFRTEFRKACEQNLCGRYNTNWGCPPGCGPIEDMIEQAKSYSRALVFLTVTELEDSFDYEGMQEGKAFYNKVAAEVRRLFREEKPGLDTLFMNAGTCKICPRCAKLDEEPCRFPEQRLISLEAYGIDVSELAKAAGMNYMNGENTVSYFGAMLYR